MAVNICICRPPTLILHTHTPHPSSFCIAVSLLCRMFDCSPFPQSAFVTSCACVVLKQSLCSNRVLSSRLVSSPLQVPGSAYPTGTFQRMRKRSSSSSSMGSRSSRSSSSTTSALLCNLGQPHKLSPAYFAALHAIACETSSSRSSSSSLSSSSSSSSSRSNDAESLPTLNVTIALLHPGRCMRVICDFIILVSHVCFVPPTIHDIFNIKCRNVTSSFSRPAIALQIETAWSAMGSCDGRSSMPPLLLLPRMSKQQVRAVG